MALPTIEGAEWQRLLEAADPDLIFIFAQHRVDEDLQLATLQTHPTNALFARMDASETNVRQLLADEWCLKITQGMAARQKISHYLSAWEAAREQVTRENQMRAEARAAGRSIEIPQSDHNNMRKAVEKGRGDKKLDKKKNTSQAHGGRKASPD